MVEDLKGKGYGKEMYQWVERYGWELDVGRMTLNAYEESEGFWMKMGFKLNGSPEGNIVKILK